MPNTLRERLAWIRDRALLATQVAAANPNVPECVAEIGQCVAELSDLLLSADAGLLDRAENEGSGEGKANGEAHELRADDPLPDATVPHPTPASVIREFMRVERGGDSPTGWTGDPFLDVDAMATEIVRLRSSPAPIVSVDGVRRDEWGYGINSLAPASVEGVVTRIESAGLPWTVVDVPDDWPIGTKVRITRVSE